MNCKKFLEFEWWTVIKDIWEFQLTRVEERKIYLNILKKGFGTDEGVG